MTDLLLILLAVGAIVALVLVRRKPASGAVPARGRGQAAPRPSRVDPGHQGIPAPRSSGLRPQPAQNWFPHGAAGSGGNSGRPAPNPVLSSLQAQPVPHGGDAELPMRPFRPVPAGPLTVALAPSPTAVLEATIGPEQGRQFTLLQGDNRLGRADGNQIQLADMAVSNHHAILRYASGQITIFDDSSTNGTLVNGQPLQRAHVLKDGDRITVGQTSLTLRFK